MPRNDARPLVIYEYFEHVTAGQVELEVLSVFGGRVLSMLRAFLKQHAVRLEVIAEEADVRNGSKPDTVEVRWHRQARHLSLGTGDELLLPGSRPLKRGPGTGR